MRWETLPTTTRTHRSLGNLGRVPSSFCHRSRRPRVRSGSVDYLPLVLLAVVVMGAAVLFPVMRRLKRAAKETLAASKQLEMHLQSYQAQQAQHAQAPPAEPGHGSSGERRADHDDPRD